MRKHLAVYLAMLGLMLGGLPKALAESDSPGTAANQQDKKECTLATLQGEYLVTGGNEARLDQPNPDRFPLRAVAVWNFDGQWGLTGFNIQNRGGRVARGDLTATYTIDSERCVATLTFNPGNQWELFIARDGSEGVAIRVDVDEEGFTEIGTRSFRQR